MTTTLTFVRDRTEERFVNDPREADWLPILGPTAWLLGKLLTEQLAEGVQPEITWDDAALGKRLGVKAGDKNSPLMRSVARLSRFGIITEDYNDRGDVVFIVRRGWGPASPKRAYRSHAPARRARA